MESLYPSPYIVAQLIVIVVMLVVDRIFNYEHRSLRTIVQIVILVVSSVIIWGTALLNH